MEKRETAASRIDGAKMPAGPRGDCKIAPAAYARGVDRQVACQVNRAEALRYLGYADQPLTPELRELIDRAFDCCQKLAQPAWCYRVFPAAVESGWAFLEGAALTFPASGALARMSACAVMACTIGHAHDREERRLSVGDATEALVFDAAGSSLVESCADACERAIYDWASAEGLYPGQRTSPGYGDLPLALSADIVRTLDAGKLLGIASTAADLLTPLKSVTALVGLFEREGDARRARRSCADCIVRADCAYLQAGMPCGAGM